MNNIKNTIKGAILIYSCHRHLNTRLKEPNFGLKKKDYNGWKVFYILGNPNLINDYEINDNYITIKCEDSYIHVLKKVVFAIKIIYSLYNIEEGILRCGDDLVFNEQKLLKFLNTNDKNDYMGKVINNNLDKSITKKFDNFMPIYYYNHTDDLLNPLNGLTIGLDNLLKMNEIPNITYTGGVIVYLSNNSCNKLIYTMNNINWDIFKYYTKFGYPYIIEDVGVGFILNMYKISPVSCNLYSDNENDINIDNDCIGYHTNKYK
jgi:hypothetical protein